MRPSLGSNMRLDAELPASPAVNRNDIYYIQLCRLCQDNSTVGYPNREFP
jgi:hypothetical protein